MRSSFIATAIIHVVTMVGGILSARLLLPEGRGELAAVILWPSALASLGSLGIVEAATFLTASRPDATSRIWATTLAAALALSAILVPVGYLLIPLLLGNHDVGIVLASRVYLAFIPLSLLTLSLLGFLLGELAFVQYNSLRVLGHAMTTLGIVFLYWAGTTSILAFTGVLLGSATLVAVAAGGVLWRKPGFGGSPDSTTLYDLVAYGLRSHLGTVASTLNLRLDQMLMSVFLPPSSLGLYVVAVTLSSAAALGANTVSLVAFPSVASEPTDERKRHALGRYVRFSLGLSLIGAGLVFWLAPVGLSLFFGEAFVPAANMARVLVVAAVPLGCNAALTAGLRALNLPQIASYSEGVSLIVTAISLAALLPEFRAIGAAWSSLIAYTTTFAFLLWRLHRDLGVSPGHLLRPVRDDWTWLTRDSSGAYRQWLRPSR